MCARARTLAVKAHHGQLDKAGKSYVEAHVADVARRVAHHGPDTEAVAWLHDVIEDTDVTAEQLRAEFPAHVVDAVEALTRHSDEEPAAYYAKVKRNPLALVVKVEGDIPSNIDPARQAALPPEQAAYYTAKYAKALEALQ